MARFCANCGTEVDETAIFCPTCGQPIDQAAEAEMPAAPGWPEPAQRAAEAAPVADQERERAAAWDAQPDDEPTRVDARAENGSVSAVPPPVAPVAPVAPAASGRPSQRVPEAGRRAGPAVDLPITMPVTLSAWLIGGGALLAALGVLIGLFDGFLNPVELILLIALLAIAAAVFFSGRIPAIPNLRLVTLVIVLIGFGIALDRLGFGGAGIGELLLFLGTASAAVGAIILELGRDQPLGPSR